MPRMSQLFKTPVRNHQLPPSMTSRKGDFDTLIIMLGMKIWHTTQETIFMVVNDMKEDPNLQ